MLPLAFMVEDWVLCPTDVTGVTESTAFDVETCKASCVVVEAVTGRDLCWVVIGRGFLWALGRKGIMGGPKKLLRTFEVQGAGIHFEEEVGLHLEPVGREPFLSVYLDLLAEFFVIHGPVCSLFGILADSVSVRY